VTADRRWSQHGLSFDIPSSSGEWAGFVSKGWFATANYCVHTYYSNLNTNIQRNIRMNCLHTYAVIMSPENTASRGRVKRIPYLSILT